jgi:hypothetical protein
MAKPRIFVSSTFYDLKQVRADLTQFIHEIGYEPVLNERGSIPYQSDEKLEASAYREVELCDILVAIVGGRYGTTAQGDRYSISQTELKKAIELGRQVYIFVDSAVLNEHRTYLLNKGNEKIRYSSVDNVKIFEFLEEIESLPQNNATMPFDIAGDIVSLLREQWAGLFQRLLQQREQIRQAKYIEELKFTAETLNSLVTFLTKERKEGDQAIRDILTSNHPVFLKLKEAAAAPYRVFFLNHDEMSEWLKARGWALVKENAWDNKNVEEWIRGKEGRGTQKLLHISKGIFEKDGRLKIIAANAWNDGWVRVSDYKSPVSSGGDDEIPF